MSDEPTLADMRAIAREDFARDTTADAVLLRLSGVTLALCGGNYRAIVGSPQRVTLLVQDLAVAARNRIEELENNV